MKTAALLTALVSKLREKPAEDDALILDLDNVVADHLVTDSDINELGVISAELAAYGLGGIATPERGV